MKYENRAENTITVIARYVILLVLVVLVESIGLLAVMQQSFNSLMAPITQQTTRFVSYVNNKIDLVTDLWDASKKAQLLEKENAVLQAELGLLQALEKENQGLKSLLEITEQTPLQENSTIVMVSNYAVPSIRLPKTSNIEVGQMIMSQGVLLGTVVEITNHQARVQLLSSLDSTTIMARTESGIEGIITGTGKRAILTDIPKDAKVTVGERITTIGQEHIQPDIFVGTVGDLVNVPTAPVISVSITQPVSFYDTAIVEVQ